MKEDTEQPSQPAGTLYLTGEDVKQGEVDLDKTINYLKGIKDTLKFYVEKENKELAGKDYSIEVRIRPGSLITDVISLVVAGGAYAYGKTALEQLAKNDTKDKTSADIVKEAVSKLKAVVRIAKHFGSMMTKRTFTLEEAHVISDEQIELINKKNEKIIVTPSELEAYRTTPPTKLRDLVAMVGRNTSLYVDDKPISAENIPKNAEEIQFKHKRVFDSREIEEDERLAFPELTQDMYVQLDGELTRGNARTDTLGFSYDGRILKAIPPEGGVRGARDSLFGPVRIEAYVDRRSTSKGSRAVLKKPILRLVSIENIEDEQADNQQALL